MTRPARSPDAAGRSGRVGDGWHPGVAGEGAVDGGEDVGAVLGGGGYVAADGVPVAGDLLGAEPAGDLLLGLSGPQVAFGAVRCGGYPQVRKEPEDVLLAVVQAFQQQPGRRLLLVRARDAADFGQADEDAVTEQPQVGGGVRAVDGV